MTIVSRPQLPRTRTMCAAFLVFAAIAAIPQVAAAQNVTICHKPPGNPTNAHQIVVAQEAVNAHLNHGDVAGACVCTPAESVCGAGQPPCCSGTQCLAQATGGFLCKAATTSNPIPPGGACNTSADCDATHTCTNIGTNDNVCQ
jgi:hypothetical protein